MIRAIQLRFVLLLAVTGILVSSSRASDFLIKNWRNEDGLPHSIINSIIQTHDGYLWIGTYVGLVRFDGARFVHFSSSNLPELESGRVSKLFEDRDGTLWIGLESGRLLAWKNGKTRIHLPGDSSLNHAIVSIAQDAEKTIWLQNSIGQLSRLTTSGAELVAQTGAGLGRSSLGLTLDTQNRLWVGTSEGVKFWRDGRLVNAPGWERLRGKPVDAMTRAQDGSIWIFENRWLRKVRDGKILVEVEAPAAFQNFAVEILEAFDGRLWLAAVDGSLFFLEPSGTWQTVEDPALRGPNRALYQDREGNIWRGTFGDGLSQLRPKLFSIHEFATPTLDRYAYSVCSDRDGNIWGLLNSRTLARIPAGTQIPQVWPMPSLAGAIRTLLVTRDNSLWAGADGGYLYRLRNGKFVSELRADKTEFISALFEDLQTNLWIGLTQGAGVGVLPKGDPAKYRELKNIPYPDVRCITEGADGAMWFGTHYGGALRHQNEKWTQFTTRDGLPSDYVRCLYTDADGAIWLGTLRGLCRWKNGKFTAITTQSGLWNDSLSHITEDENDNFWISSFGGVFHVARTQLNDFADGHRSSIQCVGYNHNDGLPSQECPGGFQPAGGKTPDGRLWFPTAGGLVSIDPTHTIENPIPPPVWIEEVIVDGATKIIYPSANVLEIAPGKRRFEFRFTALSLTAPGKIRFRHKLEGLDAEWSPAENERTVAYSYIPPGRYTFRMTACNNNGVWNPEGNALSIVVKPFFWQTWWFQLGAALLFIAILIWAVRRVERWKAHLRFERIEQQHAVERERSRIAKDIHDDLGANLTQIVFLSQRAESAANNASETAHWMHLIPATARRTIQSLDEIVWAINPRHDTLESLANYLSQFAQEHLALAGVRCVLDVPTVLPNLPLTAEVRHNLLLAAREALQNVVAHAAATEVQVKLHLGENSLNITIADNGRGFDPENNSDEGNGLHNMKKRLEDIGGQLDINRRAGKGTVVEFKVPDQRLHGRVIGAAAMPL